MKRQKGCFNEECISFERKEKYPEEYTFCPKCTQKLQYICNDKKCYTLLENPLQIYCESCQKKRLEKRQAVKDTINDIPSGVKKVAGAAGAVAPLIPLVKGKFKK